MSEAPLMNNEAARSPTGEILDQQTPATQPTEPSKTSTETATTTTETATASPTEPKPDTSTETKPAAAPAVPDKYEFKAPEGYTVDAKLTDAITPIFKELGLTQEGAQKLFDFHAKSMLDAAKGPQDAYAATRTEWQAKTQADPDIKAATSNGKTGLEAVKLDIGRAFDALGNTALVTDLRQAMDITGAGDHPAVVKALWKLSQFVTEGKHVSGGGPSPAGQKGPNEAPASVARALYPNLP